MASESCSAGPSMSYNNLLSHNKQLVDFHTKSETTSSAIFDAQSSSELLIHIQLYLASNGFQDSANQLREEIERNSLVPKRYNFAGFPCSQTYENYLQTFGPFANNLQEMVKKLHDLITQTLPPVIPNLPVRLFASKRQCLIRNKEWMGQQYPRDKIFSHKPSILSLEKAHTTRLFMSRQLVAKQPLPARLLLRKETMHNLDLHSRIFGHLAPIFCVKFDLSGRFIFTGADDNLIKVWDATNCVLRYTFRGHSGEIADIAISPENTMLASGSVDKTVRVWCLQRGKTLMVYKGHTALLTSISFLPYLKGDVRYLVSASNDCSVIFFRYNVKTKDFSEPPIKFNERSRPGVKIISSCHSPGGNLVIMGDSHQYIRIYKVLDTGVERLYELQAHTDRVDSLVWAHQSLRFLSGSKDGIAKAWSIKSNGWSSVEFNPFPSSQPTHISVSRYPRLVMNGRGGYTMGMTSSQPITPNSQAKKNAYKVTMLCWSLADDIVVSSGSDFLLRTWDWTNGQLLRVLDGHINESFALLAHPIHKELCLSAGHDGLLIAWNIYDGTILKKHSNKTDVQESASILDLAISPDGTMVVFVDNSGNTSILGLGSNQKAKSLPRKQFFSNDYMPLTMDQAGYVLDENTGLAPHNMDTPEFVSSDGTPHQKEFQRMIPGNDLIISPIARICPWVQRQIIPALSESHLLQIQSTSAVISQQETVEIEAALKNINEVIDQIPISARQLVAKKPRGTDSAQRRRNHIQQVWEGTLNRPSHVPRYIIPKEDDNTDEDDSSYAGDEDIHASRFSEEEDDENATTNSSENSGSSAISNVAEENDSDYEEGNLERSTVFRKRSALTVTGRRKKHNRREDANTASTSSQAKLPSSSRSTRTPRRNLKEKQGRRAIISSEEDVSPDHQQPSTSSAASKTLKPKSKPVNRFKPVQKAEECSPSTKEIQLLNSTKRRRGATKSMLTGFPPWLQIKERKRFPYVAQLGDEVVYFIQGHRKYIEGLEKTKALKAVPTSMRPRTDLDATEICIVDGVKYISKPIQLTCLKLSCLKNGVRTGVIIEIKHNDLQDVPDFLILKQHYDLSIGYNFKAGEKVESLLTDHYYIGTVQERTALDEDYPLSEWCSVVVLWNNDETDDDKYCPWDLQPMARGRKAESLASQEEKERWGEYRPQPSDWPLPVSLSKAEHSPQESQTIYLARAQLAISQVMQIPQAEDFKEPVDLSFYTNYVDLVDYPVDLQTIDERICNKYYRRSLSLLQDVQYLARNAVRFNRADSEIAWTSMCLVSAIFRFLRDGSIPDAGELFKQLISTKNRSLLVEWEEQLKAPGLTNSLGLTHFESIEPESGEDALQLTAVQKKSVLDNSCPAKWIADCKEMANALFVTINFLKSTEMLNFCNNRTTLQDIVNNIDELESPQSFIGSLNGFFIEFKAFIEDDHGGRRSRIYQEILKVEAQLQSKSKPIFAKFRLMNEEASKAAASLFQEPKKRAAALSALELLKMRTAGSNRKYDQLLQHQSQDKRYNTRHNSHNFDESSPNDFFDEEDDQQPCSSKSIVPSCSTSATKNSQTNTKSKNVLKVKSGSDTLKVEAENSESSADHYTKSDTYNSNNDVDSEKLLDPDNAVKQAGSASVSKNEESGILEPVDASASANGYHKFEASSEEGNSSGEEHQNNLYSKGDSFKSESYPASPTKTQRMSRLKKKRLSSTEPSEEASFSNQSADFSSAPSASSGSSFDVKKRKFNSKQNTRKRKSGRPTPRGRKRVKICEDSFHSVASTSGRNGLGRPLRRASTMKHMPGSYEESGGSEEENYIMPPTTTTRTGRAVKANSKYN